MKTSLNLIKCLHVLCIICEVTVAAGLVGAISMAPFSEAMVRNGRANVGLYAGHGALNWSFRIRLPNDAHSSIGIGSADPSARVTSENGGPEPAYGRMSFGPFLLHMENAAGPTGTLAAKDSGVAVDQVEGTLTLTRPAVAAQAIAVARWPFLVGMLATGGVGIAILELLRRMLRSAIQQEVFAATNIRHVQIVGYLIIASGILKLAAGAWLVSRMTSFVMQHVATGTLTLETYSQGDLSLLPGLLIVALAEVFRQGLTLKEENQLTI